MSRQSEAKEQQGYNPKAYSRTCSTCKNLISTPVDVGYYVKQRRSCGKGKFSVTSMALCDEWCKASDTAP